MYPTLTTRCSKPVDWVPGVDAVSANALPAAPSLVAGVMDMRVQASSAARMILAATEKRAIRDIPTTINPLSTSAVIVTPTGCSNARERQLAGRVQL